MLHFAMQSDLGGGRRNISHFSEKTCGEPAGGTSRLLECKKCNIV
jgi:hypothetical protein